MPVHGLAQHVIVIMFPTLDKLLAVHPNWMVPASLEQLQCVKSPLPPLLPSLPSLRHCCCRRRLAATAAAVAATAAITATAAVAAADSWCLLIASKHSGNCSTFSCLQRLLARPLLTVLKHRLATTWVPDRDNHCPRLTNSSKADAPQLRRKQTNHIVLTAEQQCLAGQCCRPIGVTSSAEGTPTPCRPDRHT